MNEFIYDIKNLFLGISENSNNELSRLLANEDYHNLSREDCKDLFNLGCMRQDIHSKLNLIKICIEHSQYIDLAISELFNTVSDVSNGIYLLKNQNVIEDILQRATKKKMSPEDYIRLVDTLEILYARGIKFTDKIIYFYSMLDSDIVSMQTDIQIMRSKLALLAYSADKYTAETNLEKMAGLYSMTKQNQIKHTKGMMYYYHYIFYSRTNLNELYLPLKNGYRNLPFAEACLLRSKDCGYWLTNYICQK